MAFEELIKYKTDVCLISETKIDESFPNQQFKTNDYKIFRGLILLEFTALLKTENGSVLVHIDHHLKTKNILLIIYQKTLSWLT